MKFDSFAALGAAMGFKEPQRKTPKAKKCSICGGTFRQVEGTNVLLCTGTVKNKDGVSEPCKKRLFVRAGGAA